MALRSITSLPGTVRAEWAGRADCWRAARFSGMLVGELMSAAAFGTKENPVIAPPALRLTSAVICCHRGRPAEGNEFTSSLRIVRARGLRAWSTWGDP